MRASKDSLKEAADDFGMDEETMIGILAALGAGIGLSARHRNERQFRNGVSLLIASVEIAEATLGENWAGDLLKKQQVVVDAKMMEAMQAEKDRLTN
jgi:hypothetical protein